MLEEIIVDEKESICRVAGLKNGDLREFALWDKNKANEGNIYLGKITKKIQTANGKEGYFINIGAEKEAFINAQEAGLEDLEAHEGQDVVVQVLQEQRAEKGARMTRFLRLAGIYLVYCPYGSEVEISSKIVDPDKKDDLCDLVSRSTEEGGWIIRTSAAGAAKDKILAEISELKGQFDDIIAKAKGSKAPQVLNSKNKIVQEMICHNEQSLKKVVVSSRKLKDELVCPVSVEYSATAFNDAGIEEMINDALSRTIKLKCGGRVIIEETRACVAIDVDSGEGTSHGGFGRLNQEAAHEIAKQIILRNLSGKIIIDFAGFAEFKFLKPVINILVEDLADDTFGSRVLGMSRAGNVEIVRMRRRPSLRDLLTEECPTCCGTGRVEK